MLSNIFLLVIFRVYCADHTYCTLRLPVDSTAETIKLVAADKLKIREDELLLVEVKSNGERMVFRDDDISIPTALSINGRIFVSPKDHLDALVRVSHNFKIPVLCLSEKYINNSIRTGRKRIMNEIA